MCAPGLRGFPANGKWPASLVFPKAGTKNLLFFACRKGKGQEVFCSTYGWFFGFARLRAAELCSRRAERKRWSLEEECIKIDAEAQYRISRAAFVWSCVFQGKGDAKNEPEEESDQVHRFDDRDGNHRNRERSGRRYPPHGQAVKNGLGKEILLLTPPLSRNRLPDALRFFIPRVTKRRLLCING